MCLIFNSRKLLIMNPKTLYSGQSYHKTGFRRGRNSRSNTSASKQSCHTRKRRTRDWVHKSVRLKESFGGIRAKKKLQCSLLNVNGLTAATLADVREVLSRKQPDLCILIETKRRLEADELCIDVAGYDVSEYRRSDMAGDKGGGGLAIYTRKVDGLIFKNYDPDLPDPSHVFVRNERAWKTVESVRGKTAICAVYAGFQAADDRHGIWNEDLLSVLRAEVAALRKDGFRVVLLGDFNSHIGCATGVGVAGNHPDVNRNGRRFLDFLDDCHCVHINGRADLTTGLWTRQRGGFSTVLDYGVIAFEHISSVRSMFIDDRGLFPSGGSDHNWIFLDLEDNFVRKVRISNLPRKKQTWNISHDQDWSGFEEALDLLVDETDEDLDSFGLSSRVAEILLKAGMESIGLRSPSSRTSMKATSLPRALVEELQLKRQLEANWKTKCSTFSSLILSRRTVKLKQDMGEAEQLFLDQQDRVETLFFDRGKSDKSKVLLQCSGKSPEAFKCFWSHLNKTVYKSSEIDAVLSPTTGVLHCSPEEINLHVGHHLVDVFNGSFDPVVVPEQPADHAYASSSRPASATSDASSDHPYSSSASPHLPDSDGSASVRTDPVGWMDRAFTLEETMRNVKKLKNGKAVGVDNIPNEFLLNAGIKFWKLLTLLYNKVKCSGLFPPGWNRGRVALVHKRGLKELLGNYRPLTVIISLSGLYSRLMNERLTEVVEAHELLGEIQNGFRRGRMGADNCFVLDTILWKERSRKKKVHLAFVDLTKAYDMVDRGILWNIMSGFGFGGQFLSSLKSIYTGDSVQAVVNGVSTRPVYLGRGLRQGCSLSPMLFALYISGMGQAITLSSEGFRVGGVVVSGLLFADDLVLLARDADGLLRLLSLVKRHADVLRMGINTEKDKSEVISPDGEAGDLWQVMDDNGEAILSLRQVVQYKYLGNTTMGSMHKIGVEKQKQCIKKAHKYKGSCIFMSADGPDVVDMIVATWSNVAIPSILYGTEMVPFSETTILEIERTQNQIAKYALGVPLGTAGICAQLDLGMKPFRQLLYEHQLKFYIRVLKLDSKRWVKQALLDHLSLAWPSPYISNILAIRTKLGLYEMPMSPARLLRFTMGFFVSATNDRLASLSLPWLKPIKRFKRQVYVKEDEASATLSQFRYDVANMGSKYPRVGRFHTQRDCPLCPHCVRNTVAHLAMFCPSLERIRKEQTEISAFRNLCIFKGFSESLAFELYITGQDWNLNPVSASDYLDRGRELKLLLDSWLAKW